METPLKLLVTGLTLLALTTLAPQLSTAHAQGTAFSYQGRLNSSGSAANGSYDLTFALFATSNSGSAVAGPVTNSATGVTNGLFTVSPVIRAVRLRQITWSLKQIGEYGKRTNMLRAGR